MGKNKKNNEQRKQLEAEGLSKEAIDAIMKQSKGDEPQKLTIIKNIIITRYNHSKNRDEIKVRGKLLVTANPVGPDTYNINCSLAYTKRNNDSLDNKKISQITLAKRLKRRPLNIITAHNIKKAEIPVIVKEGLNMGYEMGNNIAKQPIDTLGNGIKNHFKSKKI